MDFHCWNIDLKGGLTMKGLLPGVLSLFLTGFVYTQAYDIAGGTLKNMQAMMNGAVTQLNAVNQASSTPPSELF